MKKLIEIFVKIFVRILTIILIITISVGVAMIFNPVSRTNEGVRRYLLRKIPIGTNMETIMNMVDENDDWRIVFSREDSGLVLSLPSLTPTQLPAQTIRDDRFTVIGYNSMQVYIGRAFLISDVSAFFAFDENGELIEIFVHRSLAL